jgi:hypothetical protein
MHINTSRYHTLIDVWFKDSALISLAEPSTLKELVTRCVSAINEGHRCEHRRFSCGDRQERCEHDPLFFFFWKTLPFGVVLGRKLTASP